MNKQRRHTRFKLNLTTLDGNMLLTDNAEILNISAGGAFLQSDRELATGNKYLILCTENGKGFSVKGVVVHSVSAENDDKSEGERTPYTAHIRFEDGQTEKIARLLSSFDQHQEKAPPVEADKRRHVRFRMTIPLESILSHTARFKVTTMSLSGLCIRSEQSLELNSMIPMELSLVSGGQVTFIGRVASCLLMNENGQTCYDIGVEFMDLTDTGRSMLKIFIEGLGGARENPTARRTSDMPS